MPSDVPRSTTDARTGAAAGEPVKQRAHERALARAARAGSVPAFEELVEALHGGVQRFLHLRLASREDADELTQETFLRAWRKLERYDERWAFSTWLFAIARRLAATHERARRQRAAVLDFPAGLPEAAATETRDVDPGAAAERADLGRGIWRLAGRVLTPDQRSALWLRYGEDASVEEIARVLGKTRLGVRGVLFRARATLARHLEPDGRRRSEPIRPAHELPDASREVGARL